MKSEKITISGTGCALVDLIYNGVSFNSTGFSKYLSKKAGDGGLSPGRLVFTEELEDYSSNTYSDILKDIIGDKDPDVINVGGPSLVALILAAQILDQQNYEVKFYGVAGNDAYQKTIFDCLRKTPLSFQHYISNETRATPTTDVFSDPNYDEGHGERTFVNNIGAAWDFDLNLLENGFFESDIHCYGGTALVPPLHDNLTSLLKRSKGNDCITVVNTVFDFRNQKKHPDQHWPLVDAFDDYQLIDVLIMDAEEAIRISGQKTVNEAVDFFSSTAVSSFLITNGAKDLFAYSSGKLFSQKGIFTYPTSSNVRDRIRHHPDGKGDTTGCGDNFAGGIIAAIASQLKCKSKGDFSFSEAISLGVSAGGNCCFTVGGTYIEKGDGELRKKIQLLREDYFVQIENKVKQ